MLGQMARPTSTARTHTCCLVQIFFAGFELMLSKVRRSCFMRFLTATKLSLVERCLRGKSTNVYAIPKPRQRTAMFGVHMM